MKGIMFVGDSFTWGEGLHYFSNTSNIVFHKEHLFDINEYTKAHIAFKDKHRFGRIVADELNVWEIVSAFNGGSINKNISEIYKNSSILKDISHVIFQITDVWRGKFSIFSNRLNKKIDIDTSNKNQQTDADLKLLFDEYHNLEELVNIYQLKSIKELFIYLENLGVECRIFSWKQDTAMFFLNDKFMSDRWVYLNTFNSIEELINDNSKLSIHGVFYEKYNLQKNDFHLSLEGHKIVADSILYNIRQNDSKIMVHEKNRFI